MKSRSVQTHSSKEQTLKYAGKNGSVLEKQAFLPEKVMFISGVAEDILYLQSCHGVSNAGWPYIPVK